MPTALTIAGSDPGGGAGIQADLKTFAAHGVYGLSAVTAVTAQNTVGVRAVETVSPTIVTAQIEAVNDDFDIDAVKTGMLATSAVVAAVCDALTTMAAVPLVVDPVMVSTSGHRLLADDAVDLIRTRLLPLARVATPNREEAEALTGTPIRSRDDAILAARRLRALGADAVVITGGDVGGADAVDLFDDGTTVREVRGPRIDSRHTHGSGCTFASAITAALAGGTALAEAINAAKQYVERAIRSAPGLGHGHGPLGHFGGK
jgi:hydroxymethylpyrimidine/phosphomethylpyrimidine kinase